MGCKKKINISFVVPLSARSIAAIFIRNFPERVGRNGDDAGISTKPQTSVNPYLLSMNRTIFDKIGLPRPLAWAYLGILIFMMGDGLSLIHI